MPRKKNKLPSDAEALLAAERIAEEMANGAFVTDTPPINVAREADLLIKNFGIEKAPDVAVAMQLYDQSDPDRVSDWKDVERVIRERKSKPQ